MDVGMSRGAESLRDEPILLAAERLAPFERWNNEQRIDQ